MLFVRDYSVNNQKRRGVVGFGMKNVSIFLLSINLYLFNNAR